MRRWAKRIGVALVVALLAFVFGGVPYFLGRLITVGSFHFQDRENAGLTPKSFDLPFSEVSFTSKDRVPLKGWWVPAQESRGSVVLVHGLNRSRLEMVRKVPFLHAQGWNALLFDLRNHGESGGHVRTLGFFEADDVLAGVALARTKVPGPVVVWGVSLGAAAATLAAANDPGVAGLVCDSSYRSLRDTVKHHLVLFRRFAWWLRIVPSWPVADEVVFWIGREGGFDPDALDITKAAARLSGRPCLFVCNSGDRRMPKEIAFELRAQAGEGAKVLVVPGEGHAQGYKEGTAAYEAAVTQVLEAVASKPDPEAAHKERADAGAR